MKTYYICPVCGKNEKQHGGLRCEPATDVELQRIRRARETGKAPKPSWYTIPKLPTARVHSIKQKYPAYVVAMFTKQSDPWLERAPLDPDAYGKQKKMPKSDKLADYIREYENLTHLKPCKTTPIKVEGNFG